MGCSDSRPGHSGFYLLYNPFIIVERYDFPVVCVGCLGSFRLDVIRSVIRCTHYYFCPQYVREEQVTGRHIIVVAGEFGSKPE